MNFRRLLVPLCIVGIAIVTAACAPASALPTDEVEMLLTDEAAILPTGETDVTPTEEITEVFQADPDNLQPCGDYETMRLLQTPGPTPANVTPAPTPTLDVRPAPTEDHIGLPENYASEYKLLFVFDRPDRKLVRAICGNEIAAQHREGEPFAYGSVLMMISYTARLDEHGKPVLDEQGHFIREKLITYHMMRKEEGYGEAYGDIRSGDWEFVGYRPDGSYETAPENSAYCSACHSSQGGESIDYVFRTNMIHDGDALPEMGTNEISIYLYSFHEPILEVKVGTTITWINNDEANHSLMGAVMDDKGNIVPAPELFTSDVLPSTTIKAGSSFSFTFDKVGEYYYICTIHKNMSGKIIVTE